MSHQDRKDMVERDHKVLSLSSQCELLHISRGSIYYQAVGETSENLLIMRRMDELFMLYPFYGSRQMMCHLQREGFGAGRHRVRRLMKLMGLKAIYRKPKAQRLTSDPHPAHKTYPYLLRGLTITRPNHVWCTDITFIPMRRGFLYLVAIMDWYSRKVLSWRLSNSMDTGFCIEALEEAIERSGPPEIFNSDQGSQFTSQAFTGVLQDADIKISMDGRGRYLDNIFIERLWRSLKYECIYLKDMTDGFVAQREIGEWIRFYNRIRPHSSLDGQTPHELYINAQDMGNSPSLVKQKRAA